MSVVENTMNPEPSDSRRFLTALLVAVLLHILFFAALAIVRLAESPTPAPVSVELAPGTLGGLAFAGTPSAQARAPVQALPGQSQTAPSRAGGGKEFVIPTPRQGSMEGSQPTGPAFRTEGNRNFQTGGAPQATSPVQEPVFPSSKPSQGTAPSSGGAAGAPARGVGVLVEGGGQATSQGSLDLGSLDKSLAGVRGTGSQPGGETGGGGGGGATAGSGGGGQGGYRFQWDQPAAAQERKLLSAPQPKIPLWVSKEGLTLTVLVTFTLTPDGILNNVNVEASSGYNEVDTLVSDAVRHWRFSPDPSARPIHGLIPYVIRAR